MMDVEAHYDLIVDVFHAVPLDGTITVLTGSNGSGKSLIRSQLGGRTRKEHDGKYVVHTSMALRTGMHSHMGGLGCMVRDQEDSPTSYETLKSIQTAIRSLQGNYLVLDEIEIGCARETVMGLVGWLNANLRDGIKDSLGCMIITHSEYVVENLDYDQFLNLDGFKTAEEWVNREIKATDLEELEKKSRELFHFVIKKGREKK